MHALADTITTEMRRPGCTWDALALLFGITVSPGERSLTSAEKLNLGNFKDGPAYPSRTLRHKSNITPTSILMEVWLVIA